MRFRDIRVARVIDGGGAETRNVGADESISRAARFRAVLAIAPGDRILAGNLVVDAKRKRQRRLGEPAGRLLHLAEVGSVGGRRGQVIRVQQLLR